jgi:phospholipid/cholesterol/gamma-HCH transport system substrate-binding protein
MQNGFVETLIGAAVVIVAGLFFYYGWNSTGSGTVQGYEVIGKFERIDGINVGTDVRLSGIKIGTVTTQDLDLVSYRAIVRMNIRKDILIPDDSSIKVSSDGLLGGSYLAVLPGASESMMKDGSVFDITQGSIDLLTLFSKAMAPSSEPAPATPAPAPEAPATTPTP